MAHDVFISHAREDKKIADAICGKLESANVRCWIAPRNISPGEDWTKAIRQAISSARVVILVFSENSNAAPHLGREIACAFYAGRIIIPFRLGNARPRRDFLFYLGDARWFESVDPPGEQNLEALTSCIKRMLLDIAAPCSELSPEGAGKKTANPLKNSQDHHTRTILKCVGTIAAVVAVVWLFWLASAQIKHDASTEESNSGSMSSGRSTSLNSPPQTKGDRSASAPHYAFTRFGLWAAVNASPTPLVQAGPQDTPSIMPPGQSATATPSSPSNAQLNAGTEMERFPARDSASIKSVQEDPPRRVDQTAPIPVGGSPAQKSESVTGDPQPAKLAGINQSQGAVPSRTSSVAGSVESTPPKDETGNSFKASAEEHSLKELVLDYIRTVSSDDVSKQERFFAQRVNFYGEGVLSLPMVEASMERYCRQWPIRNWEPRGEPEFLKNLHSTNPTLYEVLQPLAWMVANGSRHKQGNTTLYVRIRKNEKGEFRIIHVEKRDRHVQSQNNS
jgi:hypothetical protein